MLVSIIIPCREKVPARPALFDDIAWQKCGGFDTEVITVVNIRPAGRARNSGAHRARGEILVFLDCDIRLDSDTFLERLLAPLMMDKHIGIVCASIQAPREQNTFQQKYARQIPHSFSADAREITDVAVASSACCALRKEVFWSVGGFHDQLMRGEDSVITAGVKHAGYRAVAAPQVYCYHPLPANISQLIKIKIRDGRGAAFADVFFRDLNFDVPLDGRTCSSEQVSVFRRTCRYIVYLFHGVCGRNYILVAAKLLYAAGYAWGIVYFSSLKITGTAGRFLIKSDEVLTSPNP